MRHLILIIVSTCCFSVMMSCDPKAENIENNQVSDSLKASVDSAWINLNEQIKKDPSNLDLFHQRAKYLYEQGEVNAAIADLRRIIKADSTQSNYYLTLGELLLTKGNGGGTKQALEKSVELEPGNLDARLKLAEFYSYVKEYKKGIEQIDEALKIDKYQPKAYFIKGFIFKETGDTAKAISSFQTTVEQDPDYYHAYIQLGLLYAAAHNKFAIDYYKNAIKVNPSSPEAYYNLGFFYQENGMPELALETYSALINMFPAHPTGNYNMGYVYSEYLNDYKSSIEHYSNAIKYAPAYVDAYYQRGYAYERMKDFKNAESDYNEALKLKPEYALANKGISRIK